MRYFLSGMLDKAKKLGPIIYKAANIDEKNTARFQFGENSIKGHFEGLDGSCV